MPRQRIYSDNIRTAVFGLIPYLEDTSINAHKTIYFDGWSGLAASAVLRTIAEEPRGYHERLNKFSKIIHLDCLRWKSRRALQRTIAEKLKLPHRVIGIFDRQDEDDDFRGVDQSSRVEIEAVAVEISRALREQLCLVIFHNGSNDTIDLNDFGIAPIDRWLSFGSKVLWTFRGRLRLNSGIKEKVDNSHLYIYATPDQEDISRYHLRNVLKDLLESEAREISGYTDKIREATIECCLYLLYLNYQAGSIMDYNWATHASSYWVCDGIIQRGQDDEAWELAAALHQKMCTDDYSCNAQPSFGHLLKTPPKRWILARGNSIVQGRTTSFFLAGVIRGSDPVLHLLPNDMFLQSDNLHVLKLCHCTFSFTCPPFRRCRNLSFLGLDSCKDQRAEEDMPCIPAVEFCKSLWVLDISYTDWELDLSPEIIQQMAANIREVHVNNGRFWNMNFAWRKLKNLRKLRVVQPTCPWETGEKDDFTNMVKMEILDLSGNNTIQVLPSLLRATSLKTLVLDGCVGLEHVEGLPPSLESFSLDAGHGKNNYSGANIICISMAGCAKLSDFKLHGSLPKLEELDLSCTKLITLDLRAQVVQVPCLQRVMLLGCPHLRAVLFPEKGVPELSFLCIDTRGGEEVETKQPVFDKFKKRHGQHGEQAYFAMMDMRFIELLMQTSIILFGNRFMSKFSINICISASGHWCIKEKMGSGSSGKICRPPSSLIPNQSYNTSTGVTIDDITIDHDYNIALQFQPLGCHVEIGEGISNNIVESKQGMKAIIFGMNKAESLHVHDNSSITTVIPEHMISIDRSSLDWQNLKQCYVVRCPKMHTVFIRSLDSFIQLENLWAADLVMARCIWRRKRESTYRGYDDQFQNLRSIHLYSCPRLIFVLLLQWRTRSSYFPNLETLHIVNCGDLKVMFPMTPRFLREISTNKDTRGMLQLPKLKHIYLHELYKLRHIFEAKIFAPNLETVRLRGCWGLRRLPAVNRDNPRRPIVDCERGWWEKLEWDGVEAGHDPSLYEPRHPSHYKKHLPRASVLR